MNLEIGKSPGGEALTVITLLIATVAASVSVSIAIAAGWQHAVSPTGRIVLAAVNMVAVLAAHLMPAICQRLSMLQKGAGLTLWLVCLLYTLQGQVGFRLVSERDASERRAAAVRTEADMPAASHRERSAILIDKAVLTEQLSHLLPQQCSDFCRARINAKRSVVLARLQVLDAEADSATEQRQRQERLDLQMRQARSDALSSQVATAMGLGNGAGDEVTAITAVMFALILEGVGALCWTVVFRSERSPRSVPALAAAEPSHPEDPRSVDCGSRGDAFLQGSPLDVDAVGRIDVIDSVEDDGHPSGSVTAEALAARIASDCASVSAAVGDGKIRLTVKDVRAFLRCGQRRAQLVTSHMKSQHDSVGRHAASA